MAMSEQITKIDFTEMYVTHQAFLRDLARFAAAAAAGRSESPNVREGWENFKYQLEVHHTVEDADLWPRVERALADLERPAGLRLLEEMEAEHALIDPMLIQVDEALNGDRDDLAPRVDRLAGVLGDHFTHEERSALPLIDEVCTQRDWQGFRDAMTKRQGLKGAAVWIPWIMDGMTPVEQQEFLKRMPAPARALTHMRWEARYRRRELWKL